MTKFDAVVVGLFVTDNERNIVSRVLRVADKKGENVLITASERELIDSLKLVCSNEVAPWVAIVAHTAINDMLVMDGFLISVTSICSALNHSSLRISVYSCYTKNTIMMNNVGQINYITDFMNTIDPGGSSIFRDNFLDQLSLGYNLGSKTIKDMVRELKYLVVGKVFNNHEKRIRPTRDYTHMLEYVVPAKDAGPNKQRMVSVLNNRKVIEIYFTDDHYVNFIKVHPRSK